MMREIVHGIALMHSLYLPENEILQSFFLLMSQYRSLYPQDVSPEGQWNLLLLCYIIPFLRFVKKDLGDPLLR
jgi:hypothetical protein